MPAMVSSAEADGSGDVASVELCYGQMLNVTGPLIEVQTCFPMTMVTRLPCRRQSSGPSYVTRRGRGKTGSS